MKSSTGKHYIGLDHIRAVAALMVFTWHFTHGGNGYPVPFDGAPALFPLALLDEGHTGVALFMVLSGYLFAKLLDGRAIDYRAFLWNRFVRLAPLLLLTLAATMFVYRNQPFYYILFLLRGFVLPIWPNGAWSIAVEAHFYLALPFLLYMTRRWKPAPLLVVALAVVFRVAIFHIRGEVHDAAYWTIIGRIDQFVLGIAAYNYRAMFTGQTVLTVVVGLAFCIFFWWFDYLGGFYGLGGYPSPSPIWIVMPTAEGVAFAAVIAYYDTSFSPRSTGVSWALSKIGEYSYSIYLLHLFVVFTFADIIHRRVMDISNFYIASAWALAAFLLMVPVGYVVYRYIEEPFLVLRKRYVIEASPGRLQIASSHEKQMTPPTSSSAPPRLAPS